MVILSIKRTVKKWTEMKLRGKNMAPDAPVQDSAENIMIERPRLTGALDEAFQKPFVVVNAGAGFGKTTAVAAHLERPIFRTVWFTCTAPDNLPARFWAHLIRVFSTHRPSLGLKMKEMGFPESLLLFDSFLADLADELYQDALTVVFVFDDVHTLHNADVREFIVNLIAARLENSVIVLLSRTWPALGGNIPVVPHMIGVEQLRFSEEETFRYLNTSGFTVRRGVAEKVHRYVSGWPIALSLVAMAMRHGAEQDFDESLLTHAKPSLYALFEQEIFSQYSAAEQELLIELSALDTFPRGLVQAVTGERERDLGQLLSANIFIRYNADRMRLSFHPLYHEFLREKLLSVDPEHLKETYRRAAAWCRENGYYYDAASYYSHCEDYDELWETLQCIDATRHNKTDTDFFIRQIERLPEAFCEQHPMTQIVLVVLQVNNLRFQLAQAVLDAVMLQLERREAVEETDRLLGEASIAHAFLLLGREQNGFEVYFKKAAALLPQGSSRWGGKLQLIDLGPGLNLQSEKKGELEKSLACFTKGVPYMVQVLHGTGQGLDALCTCEALFLTGETKKAQDPAYQALYNAQAALQYDIVGNALFMLLRIFTAMGDYERLIDTMEHVERYEQDKEAKKLGIWDIIRAWLYSGVGEVDKVALWVRNPVQKGFAPSSLDRPIVVRLRCLIASGEYAEAMALLEQFEILASSKSAVLSLIYIELGRAVCYYYMGRQEEAVTALEKAYLFSYENNIIMPVIEYGKRGRSLLDYARQSEGHAIPKQWLDEMYAKASTYAKHHAHVVMRYRQEQKGRTADYRLSPREIEWLKYLSQGLTRDEMAEAMHLSINTIKGLTKQVFAKLGAVNAAHAVHIAYVNKLI